jgi:hypothetical protein
MNLYILPPFAGLCCCPLYGKSTLVQAWTGPESSRRFRLSGFIENRHMNAVRFSALRTGLLYPPGNTPGTHLFSGYELDCPGIESLRGRDFPHRSRPAIWPPFKMGTGSFPGVKSGRRVTLTPQPVQYCGQETVDLYLYFPCGP